MSSDVIGHPSVGPQIGKSEVRLSSESPKKIIKVHWERSSFVQLLKNLKLKVFVIEVKTNIWQFKTTSNAMIKQQNCY